MLLYADDTAFYLGGLDPHKINSELSLAADKFHLCCKHNNLTLNQKKTKSLYFCPNRRYWYSNNLPLITISSEIIEPVQELKYLGIFLDKNLNFNNHIK